MIKDEMILAINEESKFAGMPVLKHLIYKIDSMDGKVIKATKQFFYYDIKLKDAVLSGENLDLFLSKTDPVDISKRFSEEEKMLFIEHIQIQDFISIEKAPLV